ncbi:heparinase II/III family protein [Paenibacillus sp. 7516]|uniref:heparinase II/III family protein n=1 Tax=Paenibacillus sp. 7516 TaxID=2022549 RepID=UPI000BA76B4C|nr:heparinase II/III family protein [Paenibacillus sp. 7516]PAF29466.1 hypothetical protein CHI14_22495 [Paenibacillus sp. 7516]
MEQTSILNALESFSDVNGILFQESFDNKSWERIRLLPYYRRWIELIEKEANVLLRTEIPYLTKSLFLEYDKSGSRKEYELVYFKRRMRLNIFALSVLLNKDDVRSIKAMEDIVWSICDEYTWCLPAHINNPKDMNTQGDLLPPYKQIDLFSAETAFTLSEIVYLLKDLLSQKTLKRVENEITKRVFEPYMSQDNSFFWETSTTNWASVCAGSIGVAAIYMIDNSKILAPMISKVLKTMEYFLKGYENDGACLEGLDYWYYGFGYYVYFSSLLKQRTLGRIDLLNQYKIHKIALFHQQCYLNGNTIASFADSSPTVFHRVGLMHFLKDRFEDIELPMDKFKLNVLDDPTARWAPLIRDFVWSNPDIQGESWSENGVFLSNAQWFISRFSKDGFTVAFAAKGGHNQEPHNHNDVGSFIIHIGEDTIFADVGSGEYTKQYFQKETRYTFFTTRSSGHSVPIIGGKEQNCGAHRTSIIEATTEQKVDKFSFDMAGAYGNANINKLIRTFETKKYGCFELILEDYIEFTDTPEEIIERFISFYKPTVSTDGIVKFIGRKHGLEMRYDPSLFSHRVHEQQFTAHDLKTSIVYIIDLKLIEPRLWNNLVISIKLV